MWRDEELNTNEWGYGYYGPDADPAAVWRRSGFEPADECELCSRGAPLFVDPNCAEIVVCGRCLAAGQHTHSYQDLGQG